MSEEVERLRAENEALSRKCSELVQSLDSLKPSHQQSIQQPDLEAIATRVLKSLKLGTQAPQYKAVKKALDQFIKEVTSQ